MDSLIHISPKFESLPLCINGSYLKLVQWEGGYTQHNVVSVKTDIGVGQEELIELNLSTFF